MVSSPLGQNRLDLGGRTHHHVAVALHEVSAPSNQVGRPHHSVAAAPDDVLVAGHLVPFPQHHIHLPQNSVVGPCHLVAVPTDLVVPAQYLVEVALHDYVVGPFCQVPMADDDLA